jgi:hypothetical protein
MPELVIVVVLGIAALVTVVVVAGYLEVTGVAVWIRVLVRICTWPICTCPIVAKFVVVFAVVVVCVRVRVGAKVYPAYADMTAVTRIAVAT